MQLSDSKGEDGVDVDCMTAVGASMLGCPMWPRTYNNFVHAADHDAWVRDRLAQADFNPIGVTEGSCSLNFVRHVLASIEESWQNLCNS